MTFAQGAQALVGLAVALWAGSYWWAHRGEPHLLAYGVGLHLYGIAVLAAATVQLAQLLRIDYRQPVLQVQAQLLELRRVRVRCERALLLCAPRTTSTLDWRGSCRHAGVG